MAFIDQLLQEPSYGWKNAKGGLMIPTGKQLWSEAFSRINIFKTRKNWISLISWLMVVCMVPFLITFLAGYFSWYLFIAIVIYSMLVMGTHGTIWFHRFCTHKAYQFSHPLWRIITQNLVIRTFPEEIYVLSHHVHHVKSDMPGDPYNPQGGLLYCMLSDVNHQSINKHLEEGDYNKARHFMKHTGVPLNSFRQYQKWGSVSSPFYTVAMWLLNWSFWYLVFYLVGGHGLACALFTGAMMWFILVRAFNYTGHGKGEAKHQDGVDFDRTNLSLNQVRPGIMAGEWHNNHHLYPGSARSGFLRYQLDFAWVYIYVLYKLGMVRSYKDSKKEFMRKYILTGSVEGMKPLYGKAYTKKHLAERFRR